VPDGLGASDFEPVEDASDTGSGSRGFLCHLLEVVGGDTSTEEDGAFVFLAADTSHGGIGAGLERLEGALDGSADARRR
jgi:hypothetical protein